MERRHIPLKTKLAAALCALLEIPHDHAKAMHEDQILSLVEWDHYPIPKAHDGQDVHYNLVPRAKLEHRKKTAEIDVPQIAKTKRIAESDARHKAVLAAKIGLESENMDVVRNALAPVAKRPWPKRAIQNRPFNSKGKRRFAR